MLNDKEFGLRLKNIKVALFDLDGTIYIGENVIDGAIEGLKKLRENNVKIVFLTNNSSRTTNDYIIKLKNMNLFEDGDEVLTSQKATADYLCTNHLNKKVYCFATQSVKSEMQSLGVEVVEDNPSVALLLYNKEINYESICKFNNYIAKGVKYIAAQSDNVCPADDIYLPDCGAFIEMFATACGRRPELVVGKPNSFMGDTIMREYSLSKEQVLMVGDRLYTDIRFGKNCGFLTVLVTCGETTLEQLSKSQDVPDYCCDSVFEMTKHL